MNEGIPIDCADCAAVEHDVNELEHCPHCGGHAGLTSMRQHLVLVHHRWVEAAAGYDPVPRAMVKGAPGDSWERPS